MKCDIKGVILEELTCHIDSRGWLAELYRQDELETDQYPVMSYLSLTKPGVVRGPHEHKKQNDLFIFTGTSTFRLFLWDNRRDSYTCGLFFQFDAPENKLLKVLVPPGVVHAYKNIGPTEGLVFNAPNRLFKGKDRKDEVDEIRYEDDEKAPFRVPE